MQTRTPPEIFKESPDEPLPLTLRFVFVIGALILIGWFLMFFLLQERW